jgi:hypothetical protein
MMGMQVTYRQLNKSTAFCHVMVPGIKPQKNRFMILEDIANDDTVIT